MLGWQLTSLLQTTHLSTSVELRNLKEPYCESDGIRRILFEPDAVGRELMASKIDQDMATHILFTMPLRQEPHPSMDQVWNQIQKWWDVNPEGKLGILSTTGVYRDHNGALVTEDSPVLCENSRDSWAGKNG